MTVLRVTLLQFAATADPERNLDRIDALLDGAHGADLIALPEVCVCRGTASDYREHAEPIPGPATARLAGTARTHKAWLLCGSLIEKARSRIYNTTVLFAPDGEIAATYRKIHLFEARMEDGRIVREADFYSPGAEPVLVRLKGWRCGLSICYDVRFPELYRHYAEQGAEVLLVPADFTQNTGRDHWDVLLRSRAIENQCFVVAPNQCGANPKTGVESYGHSMVVGPWGEILCRAGRGPERLTVTLDRDRIEKTRRRIPALRHRRL